MVRDHKRKAKISYEYFRLKTAGGSVEIQGQWTCEAALRGFWAERSSGVTWD